MLNFPSASQVNQQLYSLILLKELMTVVHKGAFTRKELCMLLLLNKHAHVNFSLIKNTRKTFILGSQTGNWYKRMCSKH